MLTFTKQCPKRTNVKLVSKSNSVDLYRPPALRHNSSEEATAAATAAGATNETVPESEAAPQTTATEIISTTTSVARKRSPGREQASTAAAEAAAATRRERRPDRAVYVPRARRSQTTPPTTTTMPMPTPTGAAAPTTCNQQLQPQPQPQSQPLDMPVVSTNPSKSDDGNGQQQHQQTKTKKSRSRRDRGKKSVGKIIEPDTLLVIAPSENQANQIPDTPGPPPDSNCDKETMRTKTSKTHKQQQPQSLRIEDAAPPKASNAPTTEDVNKCDNEVRELQRASKEINRSNRRIMKQTFVSDVLEIPEKIESAPQISNATVTAATTTTAAASAATATSLTPPADSTTEDDDDENEDDWENMFDENGDCLNPKILQELTESVGKCKIELPKMDYSLYHIKQSLLNEEEFPHVLEISNFPVEFKTPDLLMLFSQYKSAGFDIKWVDDTHALAVFSSSRIAAEVLTMGHPFVKLKPLAEATLESRLKAKKAGATSLQPYRQRPETCTALARRLVSGALGVKLPTAPEERENERRVLREAKERKLLAAKQRDEVWES
ncbi:PREDICTED: flocculation protein FLO11 isoform X1 [Drosophila arizonae]|uniref:Flocculation protein FLO11 isoform X1 n=1 Tax=Drosophila arizonae TaxID=7263 RepID=A0ABM1P631_DROAR|nr:PREDICTED: flocculation protein FLO11 isoform X1 [Drosophila arizonae]